MHTRRKLLFWTRGMTRKMFVLKNGLTLRDNEIYLCVCDWWPWKPRELSGNNAVLSLMQSKKWMSFSFFVIFSPLFLADPLRSWCSSLRAVQPFSLYSGLGGGQACNPTGQRCNFHGVHASHKWSRFVNSYLKDSQAFSLSAHIFMGHFLFKMLSFKDILTKMYGSNCNIQNIFICCRFSP